MKNRSPALSGGLVVGLLFFAHAMIKNSHAWPMVWPLVAGAAAVVIAARREQLHGFWSGIGIAAKSGLNLIGRQANARDGIFNGGAGLFKRHAFGQ